MYISGAIITNYTANSSLSLIETLSFSFSGLVCIKLLVMLTISASLYLCASITDVINTVLLILVFLWNFFVWIHLRNFFLWLFHIVFLLRKRVVIKNLSFCDNKSLRKTGLKVSYMCISSISQQLLFYPASPNVLRLFIKLRFCIQLVLVVNNCIYYLWCCQLPIFIGI